MSDSDLNDRMRQLRNLVVMAMADGSIGEREVDLMAERCHELGLDEGALQHAIRYGLGDEAALELPSDPEERDALMIDLVRMMAADGKLEENEKRLFALAAARMGISGEQLSGLLDRALQQ